MENGRRSSATGCGPPRSSPRAPARRCGNRHPGEPGRTGNPPKRRGDPGRRTRPAIGGWSPPSDHRRAGRRPRAEAAEGRRVTIVDETAQRLAGRMRSAPIASSSARTSPAERPSSMPRASSGPTRSWPSGSSRSAADRAQGRETVQRSLHRIATLYAEGVESSREEVEALKGAGRGDSRRDRMVRDFDQRILARRAGRSRAPAELEALADAVVRRPARMGVASPSRRATASHSSVSGPRPSVRHWRTTPRPCPTARFGRGAAARDPGSRRGHGPPSSPLRCRPGSPRPGRAAAQGGEVRFLTADDKACLKASPRLAANAPCPP